MTHFGIPGVDGRLPSRGQHLWRGNVVRLDGRQAWVEVPALYGDNPAGPFDMIDFIDDVEARPGDRVLVAAVGGDQDDLVIVGKLK